MEDLKERVGLDERLDQAAVTGMTMAVWADVQPDKPAVIDAYGKSRTFAEVNANANRLARLFRQHGVQPGDSLALVCSNRVEFIEVLAATMRAGVRITPVNWHLNADEIAYIINDCEAKVLVGDVRVAVIGEAATHCPHLTLKLSVGGDIDGFVDYDTALVPLDGSDISDPVLGNQMMYTSGTTGRPKGVYRPTPVVTPVSVLAGRGYDDTSIQLCAGPAYHAAPLAFDVRAAMGTGSTLIFMDKWDSEQVLRTISEQKVTHLHMVPIMFQRLLDLPAEVKAKYPVDHVRYIVHGAAPCPPEVKQAMIEWFGPVLSEYYAGSEGGAGFTINSDEWLKKPGSVGKRPAMLQVRIIDEQGNDCPNGVPGTIYHQLPPGGGFQYYKDEAKTQASRVGDFFTMGDVGYFDEDDYLFLTGRSAETIISGGVNIYPQECENLLITHPKVADAAVFGVPNADLGEEVKAVVQLMPGVPKTGATAEELIAFCGQHLARQKVPRSVDFEDELPRLPTGKLYKRLLRDRYWGDKKSRIV
jgi:long-chain acyl-CoA synthetase